MVTPDEEAAALDSGVVTGGVEIMTVVDDGTSTDEDAAAVDWLAGVVFVCSQRVQIVEVLVIMTVLVVSPTLVVVTPLEV